MFMSTNKQRMTYIYMAQSGANLVFFFRSILLHKMLIARKLVFLIISKVFLIVMYKIVLQ